MGSRRVQRIAPAAMMAVAAMLAAALTACGSAASTDAAASKGTTAASAGGNPSDALLAFARCLRDHGIEVPDPRAGDITLTIPKGVPKDVAARALQACAQYEPHAKAVVNDPAHHDFAVKMASCLRARGIDAPEPVAGQPLVIHPHGDEAGARTAYELCEKKVAPSGPGS